MYADGARGSLAWTAMTAPACKASFTVSGKPSLAPVRDDGRMTEDPASHEPRCPPPIARGGWLDLLRFVVGAMIVLYHFREAAPIP